MSQDLARIANLLGTFSLLVVDEQRAAVEEETGLQASAAAALVTLGHAPGETIDFLSRVLDRSHSTMVRLVGRLAEQGLVRRRDGVDGRSVSLALNAAGSRLVRRALDRRVASLASRLEVLEDDERADLTRLLEKLLGEAVEDELHAYRLCRLCDGEVCPEEQCPVELSLESR